MGQPEAGDEWENRRFCLLGGQYGTPPAAHDYIKSGLTPAVDLLADDNPEFVCGFKQANKQDDRRGGHSPKTPTPPAT